MKEMIVQTTAGKTKIAALSWLRFPLALLIISIHTAYSEQKDDFVFYLGTFVSKTIADIAVPAFFFISGYLFFLNRKYFGFDEYLVVMRKKAKSLLALYVIWNVVAYIMVVVGNYFYLHRGIGKVMPWELYKIFWAQDSGLVLTSVFGYEFSYLSGPINGSLWFVRDLMVAMAISPISFFIIKRLRHWSPLFFIAPYLLLLGIPIKGFGLVALCFFGLGAYFSIMNLDICKWVNKYQVPIIFIASMFIFVSYYIYLNSLDYLIVHQLKRLICVPLTILVADILSKNNPQSKIIKIGETSFWIYVVHSLPIMVPIVQTFSAIQNIPVAGGTLYYLTSIIMKIVLCVGSYYFLKRVCPKALNFVVGGR